MRSRRSFSSEGQRAVGNARAKYKWHIYFSSISSSRSRAVAPALSFVCLYIFVDLFSHFFIFFSEPRISERSTLSARRPDDFRVCDSMNSKQHICRSYKQCIRTAYKHTSKKERNNDDDEEEKKSEFVSLLRHSSLIKYAACARAGARLTLVYKVICELRALNKIRCCWRRWMGLRNLMNIHKFKMMNKMERKQKWNEIIKIMNFGGNIHKAAAWRTHHTYGAPDAYRRMSHFDKLMRKICSGRSSRSLSNASTKM